MANLCQPHEQRPEDAQRLRAEAAWVRAPRGTGLPAGCGASSLSERGGFHRAQLAKQAGQLADGLSGQPAIPPSSRHGSSLRPRNLPCTAPGLR